MGNALILAGGSRAAFSSDLTATAAQVLNGKTYIGYDSDEEDKNGSMPNNQPQTYTINNGETQVIPRGYHDGTGKVQVKSLAAQTPGTAAPGQILATKTAWVNGQQITGTMVNQGARTFTINCGGQQTIPAGYHNGSGTVSVNPLSGQTTGNAAPANILDTKTAWVNGSKITGTMPNRGAQTATIDCGASQRILQGYHNGSGSISVTPLSTQTQATALVSTIRNGYTAWVNGKKITGTAANTAGGTFTPGTATQTLALSGKYLTSNITVLGDANLVPGNIRAGYTLFGVQGSFVTSPIQLVQPVAISEPGTNCYANGFGEWIEAYMGANITNKFVTYQTRYYQGGQKKIPGVHALSSSNTGTSANFAFFRSSNSVKLTNYNRLYYDISEDDISGDEIIVFGISNQSKLSTNSFTRSVTFTRTSPYGSGYLDISGVTGNYYIYLMLNPRVSGLYAHSNRVYLTT